MGDEIVMGSLCTGVAGLDLGLHQALAGRARIAWYAEVNPDASAILAQRIPGVANLGDFTAVDWATISRVDLLAAGFPCQPVSAAGKQKGTDDHRWLWPEVRRCYRALRPQELVFENVRNLISIRKGELFAQICQDLRDDGYAVRYGLAGACAVGAPHHRHRVFVVARYAWQLDVPPAERVDMLECGARRGKSRVLLATPGGPVRHSLDAAHLLLPTPDAYAGSRGGARPTAERVAGGHGINLQDVICDLTQGVEHAHQSTLAVSGQTPIHGMLPSPQASDGARGPNPPAWPADNLTTAVDRIGHGNEQLLPTPRASDTGTPGRRASDGFRPPLSQVIAEVGNAADQPGGDLTDQHAGIGQDLLPTPRARDEHGGDYDADRQQARRERSAHGGPSLPDVAQQDLLPTPNAGGGSGYMSGAHRDTWRPTLELAAQGYEPTVGGRPPAPTSPPLGTQALLPTPTCGDSSNSRNATAGRSPDAAPANSGWTLCDVTHNVTGDAVLLPTPRHSDADKGSPNQHGTRPGDLMLPSAVIGARYGRYAPAVALWEYLTGTPAPDPTVANSKGQWRLNPALPEWMMGYPPGWITGLVGRSAALRGAGNGVVPQVVAAVYPILTAGWPYLHAGDVHRDPIPAATPPRTAQPAAARRAEPAAVEQLALPIAG